MKTILKTSVPVMDETILAELNATLPAHIKKAMNDADRPRNGFWAYASVEDPNGDSDGDVIDVAGIECDMSPSDQKYIPLLGSHLRKLPDGGMPQLGRIESVQKTKCKDMSAMAMYFTFALKEDGAPINARVGEHYEAYKAGYCNAFSVGMEATAEPIKIKDKGFRYPKTKLYEVSMVGIGANQHSLAITRSKEAEDELTEAVKSVGSRLDAIVKTLADLTDDVESLSAVLYVEKAKPAPVAKVDGLTAELAAMAERMKTRK